MGFGCIRDSDLLQPCASKVRMRPFQPPSRGRAPAGGAPAAEEPLPFAHLPRRGEQPTFLEHVLCSPWSAGWRSAGEEALQNPTRISSEKCRVYTALMQVTWSLFFHPPSRQMYCLRKMQEKQGCSFHLHEVKAVPMAKEPPEKRRGAARAQW